MTERAHTRPDSAPARQQGRSIETQRKMVESAFNLIAEGGLAYATLARVGERAGYSRGLTDYHFESKTALVEQVVKMISRRWAQSLRAEGIDGQHGIRALVRIVEMHLRRIVTDPRDARVHYAISGESALVDPEIAAVVARHDAAFRQHLRHRIDEGREEGTIRWEVDSEHAAILVMALLRGLQAQWIVSPETFDLMAVYRATVDVILDSFGRPAAVRRLTDLHDTDGFAPTQSANATGQPASAL